MLAHQQQRRFAQGQQLRAAQGLGHFNNYTLAPVLLLVFFLIGVLVDRS